MKETLLGHLSLPVSTCWWTACSVQEEDESFGGAEGTEGEITKYKTWVRYCCLSLGSRCV